MKFKILLSVFIFFFVNEKCSSYKYLITMPQIVYRNTTQKVCASFFNSTTSKNVSLYLANSDQDVTHKLFMGDESGCLGLPIPESLTGTRAVITIKIHDESSDITEVANVQISESYFTLIQTDKPIYKPGQTVKFRILSMNSVLLPILDLKRSSWIEDPNKVKVAQWKNMDCPNGLCSTEMLLSEEPVLGEWTIFTKIGTRLEERQTFQVEEYVLPKFEVTIKPPPYILIDTEYIDVEVCAKYTYGKSVKGNLLVKMKLKGTFADKTSVEEIGKIDGCKMIKTKGSHFDLESKTIGSYIYSVYAEVKETNTGVKINTTHPEVEVSAYALKLNIRDYSKNYFKPGLPYFGKLLVTEPDYTPAADINIKVEVIIKEHSRFSKVFKSNSDGIVTFTIPAISEDTTYFTIKVTAQDHNEKILSGMRQPYETYFVRRWYSKSHSFVQIKPLSHILNCEKTYPITILYTTEDSNAKIDFYYQVMSRGSVVLYNKTLHSFDIEKSGVRVDNTFLTSIPKDSSDDTEEEIPPFVDTLTIDLPITVNMSPKMYLLVYFYVIQDNNSEIVADSHSFKIKQCFDNKANMNFLQTKVLPGEKVKLKLNATPKSLCALGIVDKSVHILKKSNQLNKERVFDHLNKFDPQIDYYSRKTKCVQVFDFDYFDPGFSSMPGLPSLPGPRSSPESSFYGGMSDYYDSSKAFQDVGTKTISNIELETKPCNTFMNFVRYMSAIPGLPGPGLPGLDPMPIPMSAFNTRDFPVGRPEKTQKSESLLDVRNYFPETWLWELKTVNDSGTMILQKEVPHTITTWIGDMFCIHSSTGLGVSPTASLNAFQPFFVSLDLPYSIIRGETVPVTVSIFNYLPDSISVKLNLEKSKDFILNGKDFKKICINGAESKVHRFVIQPQTLGSINVTVHAKSVMDKGLCGNNIITTPEDKIKDSITQAILVEAEGFPKEHIESQLVCPKDSPDGIFKQTVIISLPEDLVNGSARTKINVIGDIMGPVLSGLDKLVQLPTGCGEQNMALFAPLVSVRKYLKSTNQVLPELNEKADKFIQSGYQRQSNYLHDDGSYSAFGQSDSSGSLWLTAFVVKTFVQAQAIIDIDLDLVKSIKFIQNQQKNNGCFENVGNLLQKSLMGGLQSSGDGKIILSAFVMISLLEAQVSPESETIKKAILCITSKEIDDIYGLSLITYALTLAGEYERVTILLQKIEDQAKTTDNTMYWSKEDNNNKALSVEIAAYNLLTYSHMLTGNSKHLIKALAIVQWLSQQRNPYGGFFSTQDTVIALEALAAYSAKTYDENININLSVKGLNNTWDFQLTQDNRLILQTQYLSSIYNLLEITATGIGCSLVQVITLYNVGDNKVKEVEPFTLSVTVNPVISGHGACRKRSMHICSSYRFTNAATDMTIIEVKMVTGYWPDKNSLKLLMAQNPQVKRYEIDNKMVNFYFDEITDEEICINFIIEQHIDIKDVKPGTVRVYDYYNQDISKSVIYTVDRHSLSCLSPKSEHKPANKNDVVILSSSSSTNESVNTSNPKSPIKFFKNGKHHSKVNQSEYKHLNVSSNDNTNELSDSSIDDSPEMIIVGEPEYRTLPTLREDEVVPSRYPDHPEPKCFSQNNHKDVLFNLTCPVCDVASKNWTDYFCSADFAAYGTTSMTSAIILHVKNGSYTTKVQAVIQIAPSCTCNLKKIGKQKNILIFGKSVYFDHNIFINGCILDLNENFHIISTSSEYPIPKTFEC